MTKGRKLNNKQSHSERTLWDFAFVGVDLRTTRNELGARCAEFVLTGIEQRGVEDVAPYKDDAVIVNRQLSILN